MEIKEDKEYMNWADFEFFIYDLARQITRSNFEIKKVYGIPRGGLIPAVKLSHLLNLQLLINEQDIDKETIVVDEIIDKGKTMLHLKERLRTRKLDNIPTASLVLGQETEFIPNFSVYRRKEDWIVMPWEEK